MVALVTGSSGLIGSEVVVFLDRLGWTVLGIDNNMRAKFFGPEADTMANRLRLEQICSHFTPIHADIRDRATIDAIMQEYRPNAIIHTAAQPSHDWAATNAILDFEINATATLILLNSVQQHSPKAVFIYCSTNKVYGDGINNLALRETELRFDFADPSFQAGINETTPIDQVKHSIFGVSKCAGDLLSQEYGRYFGLRTTVLRCGCVTGRFQSGVESHGFLNHLVKCAHNRIPYTIFGYRGKQVRDQIHSRDVAQAIHQILLDPGCGDVYNIGGGRENSASILECICSIEDRIKATMDIQLSEHPRIGDHICYYTDTSKFCRRYPSWHITRPLHSIIDEMLENP